VRSAIILVGGEGRRVAGREKYFFRYEGKTFIERLIVVFDGVVDEILLVARSPEQCERFKELRGIRCVADKRQGIGPVGGLHAGACAASGDLLFVTACDMPCVNPAVVGRLFEAVDGFDAAIPEWRPGMIEPLHAVYRQSAVCGYLSGHHSSSLRSMVEALRAVYVPVEDFRTIDPDLRTFLNINRLEDLEGMDQGD
jgi:molybdopterin-guanine dinucleotide biosynthesis protein A